jgi:hypothetical protein
LLSSNWHTLFDLDKWDLEVDAERNIYIIVLNQEMIEDEIYKDYNGAQFGYSDEVATQFYSLEKQHNTLKTRREVIDD